MTDCTTRKINEPDCGRVEALHKRRQFLDQRINAERKRPLPDNHLLTTLKKRKLAMKDVLVTMQKRNPRAASPQSPAI